MERIDITIDERILALNGEKQARLKAVHAFEETDRTPVCIDLNQYALLAVRGSDFQTYIRSPLDNLREQILNRKWQYENIRDDSVIATRTWSFGPDFSSLRGAEFDIPIDWSGEAPKSTHPLTEPEQIDSLAVPAPDNGLNRKYIDWTRAMQAAAADFDVRFNGNPMKIEITRGHGGGPIPAAFALAGENMLVWMLTEPERMHRLMDIVTTSHINCVRFFDDMFGRRYDHGLWLGCDTAEMLSPDLFREFVVPYYTRIWEAFPGQRSFHMCGRIDHLLEIIRDDLKINMLSGFGFPTDRNKLADVMAGRVVMSGGPSPMLVKDGPIDRIQAECRSYIETVGAKGGYILHTGGGVNPGTAVGNLEVMIKSALCPVLRKTDDREQITEHSKSRNSLFPRY